MLRGGRRLTGRHSGDMPTWRTAASLGFSTSRCREHAGEGATLHGTYRWRSTMDSRRPADYRDAAIRRGAFLDFFSLCRYGPAALSGSGASRHREKCLFSYWIPSASLRPRRPYFRSGYG